MHIHHIKIFLKVLKGNVQESVLLVKKKESLQVLFKSAVLKILIIS